MKRRLAFLAGAGLLACGGVLAQGGPPQVSARSRLSAAAVALKVAARMKPYRGLPGGEVYTSRHGYFDALRWGGACEQVG